MNAIYDFLEKDERYSTISRNTETGKVEIVVNDNRRPFTKGFMIADISSRMREKGIPKFKDEAALITVQVEQYADDHPYSPKKSTGKKNGWLDKLTYNDSGKPDPTINNITICLEECSYYKGRLWYDAMGERFMIDNRIMDLNEELPEIRKIVEAEIGINSKDLTDTAVQIVCKNHKRNPLIEACKKIKWDGTPRLERLFIDVLGAPDTDLTRRITMMFWYGLMKRAHVTETGKACPLGSAPVLQDEIQGTGKTEMMKMMFETLGLDYLCVVLKIDEKFINNKDIIHKIKGASCVIFDEAQALMIAEDAWLKSFITEKMDTERLSYAREAKPYLRKCVFMANTNPKAILKDYSNDDGYERRFNILECHGKKRTPDEWDEVWDDNYRKQVWAELYKFFIENPDYDYLTLRGDDIDEMRKIQQRFKTYSKDGKLSNIIEGILNYTTYKKDTYTNDPLDVRDFCIESKDNLGKTIGCYLNIIASPTMHAAVTAQYGKTTPNAVNACMRNMGWDSRVATIKGRNATYLFRKEPIKDKLSGSEKDIVENLLDI